jgi:hypothetical protein
MGELRRARALILAMSECLDAVLDPKDQPGIAWRCKRSTGRRAYTCEVSGEIISGPESEERCVECGKIYLQCGFCATKRSRSKRGAPQPVFSGVCVECQKSLNVCDICTKEIYTLKGKNVTDYYACAICEECICVDHADELRCTNCQTTIYACSNANDRHDNLTPSSNSDADDDDDDGRGEGDDGYAIRCRRCKFKRYQHRQWQ